MKALTAAEMQEVDRLTTERFGVPGHQLMESALGVASLRHMMKLSGGGRVSPLLSVCQE